MLDKSSGTRIGTVAVKHEFTFLVGKPAVDQIGFFFHVVEDNVDAVHFIIFGVGLEGEQFQIWREVFTKIKSRRADVRTQIEEVTCAVVNVVIFLRQLVETLHSF